MSIYVKLEGEIHPFPSFSSFPFHSFLKYKKIFPNSAEKKKKRKESQKSGKREKITRKKKRRVKKHLTKSTVSSSTHTHTHAFTPIHSHPYTHSLFFLSFPLYSFQHIYTKNFFFFYFLLNLSNIIIESTK